jgi:uncharacterized membrane protein
MSYLIWKSIHVLSVVAFLGNILTGLFWAARAHRSRDNRLIETTFDGIIRSDRIFTVPGVVGILVSGIAAAIVGGFPILGTAWILWPSVLFALSGVVFGIWVVPLQRSIRDLAAKAESWAEMQEQYRRLYRRWEAWGLAALLTPVAAAVIMVLKPPLPGL